MDKRILQSGQVRLRFKFHQEAYNLIMDAIKLVGCKYPHTAIERISLDFLGGITTKAKESAKGTSRFLVRLYPDQYEIVQLALDEARNRGRCEEDALFHICNKFIHQDTSWIKN